MTFVKIAHLDIYSIYNQHVIIIGATGVSLKYITIILKHTNRAFNTHAVTNFV